VEGKWFILAKCAICKKDKVESAKKGNCKEWNFEGNGIYKE